MSILFYFMLAVFISYVAFIWIKYGIQPSISDSYYILPLHKKFLFILFCFGFAIPAIMIGFSSTLMFIAGSLIMFVGAAPLFKQSLPHIVHMIGAYGGIIAGELALCTDYHLWPIAACFAILAILLMFIIKPKNKIWWVELLAFVSICVGLGIEAFINF